MSDHHVRPKPTSRVWNVNLLLISYNRVGPALQATVETLYEKWSPEIKYWGLCTLDIIIS